MALSTSAAVSALVRALTPFDEVEAEHRADALAWLASTDDVYRRVSPKTPAKHLVTYFLLRDPGDGSVLLVHHRRAGLWLPTGGHVEPGEEPAQTVRREALEELGIPAVLDEGGRPRFVTVTGTTGAVEDRHVDVTLWYLLSGRRSDALQPDDREFSAVRWWTRAEVDAAHPRLLEPHLARFLTKIDAS